MGGSVTLPIRRFGALFAWAPTGSATDPQTRPRKACEIPRRYGKDGVSDDAPGTSFEFAKVNPFASEPSAHGGAETI
jgi:hypothetical protein